MLLRKKRNEGLSLIILLLSLLVLAGLAIANWESLKTVLGGASKKADQAQDQLDYFQERIDQLEEQSKEKLRSIESLHED